MDDMRDAIALVSGSPSEKFILTRRAKGTRVNGMRVAGAATTSIIRKASMQPINGRELERLPEGMRTMELRVFFSPVEVKTAGPSNEPDLIEDPAGEVWEVQAVKAWVTLGDYWRAVVAKVAR